jgi:hypothetical protein
VSRRRSSSLAQALPLVALLACAACASFRGDELPRRGLGELRREAPLPAVTYGLSNNFASSEPPATGWSVTCVDRVFGMAFSEIERKASTEGLHLDVRFASRVRQPVFTVGLGLFSILSLGLIPAYGRDDLSLSVRVEVDGSLVKRYEYQDHAGTWFHWFMIPWAFSHDPFEVENAVLENMLLNFLHDFRQDLPGFPSPAAS